MKLKHYMLKVAAMNLQACANQLSHSIAYFEGLEQIDAKSLHSAWSVVVFLRICDDIRRFLIPTFLSFMISWMKSKSYTSLTKSPSSKSCYCWLFIELMNSLKSFLEVGLLTLWLIFFNVASLFFTSLSDRSHPSLSALDAMTDWEGKSLHCNSFYWHDENLIII